jgi:hypothetical protein
LQRTSLPFLARLCGAKRPVAVLGDVDVATSGGSIYSENHAPPDSQIPVSLIRQEH